MRLLRTWGAGHLRPFFPLAMVAAVDGCSAPAAELLHSWAEEDGMADCVCYLGTFYRAAAVGCADIMRLCVLWGCLRPPPQGEFDGRLAAALGMAARGGHAEAMRACREMAGSEFETRRVDGLLWTACSFLGAPHKCRWRSSRRALCWRAVVRRFCVTIRLCREWGATRFGQALVVAAGQGFVPAMRLCREWGAAPTPLSPILLRARGEARKNWRLTAMNTPWRAAGIRDALDAVRLCDLWIGSAAAPP